ncbi:MULTISPECIES: PAS domain-containing sensor histidine kinase [Myxococcus]|uniref:PAS domain-containing sensor histidine kinase n=1 Tax=Myxococcus TaxID=32 RepID=UPI00112C90AC|nr:MULTISPECIES: PAS domain-containing protein [Myxococcus]QDF00644.1 PAS domain-containing sensor histidine kinase [Myxococcus xanthus]WAM26082.1 PAS domain-containing protein [Myxococcus sp. NMCA1]
MPQSLLHRYSEGPSTLAAPEEARPFLGALLSAAGCGVALLDRDLRPVWVNATLAALSGLEPRAHVGRPLTELWPQVAQALSPLLARALSGEDVTDAPVRGVLAPAAGERHLRVGLSPALQGGALAGVALWVRDETERFLEEQRLRARESHMRSLADVACDGHFLHDNGIVMDANRAMSQLLGYASPSEMIGRHLADYVAPEFRSQVGLVLSRGLETPYEVVVLRRDGQRLPLEVLGRYVTWEGRQVRLAAVWDISSRKAAEELSANTEQFRHQMLGAVDAELRAPLQSLQEGTRSLQRLDGLEEPQRTLVSQVARSARRMERMLQELMDFTRTRLAGGLALRPEPAVLDAVAARVVEERRREHPRRTLHLETEGDLRGHWDTHRLAQLADNLLGSVLHQGGEDSPVTLRVVGAVGGVTLCVKSPGLTVAAEEHSSLFEPFRKERGATPEGLGLGLYLARQIAVAHGGKLAVESCSGGGVSFTAWLPREGPGH